MDYQDQIKIIHEARDEKVQQQEREKFVKESAPNPSNTELISAHENKMADMRPRHREEEHGYGDCNVG
ncbi:hypothetical protein V6N13_026991 [Hibiscus sabdariffa]|uniref:Uncharacterized protein n=2 Tax=Hibiscus sabdariffa TaxID=183260 RepID=A0ABR2N9V0_9ROSI